MNWGNYLMIEETDDVWVKSYWDNSSGFGNFYEGIFSLTRVIL
jgi:hypothetical protein